MIVDPADIPHAGEYDDAELEVLLYEFKADLERLPRRARARTRRCSTLADVIAFNEAHREREMPYFGQELFVTAQEKGPLTDAGVPRGAGEEPPRCRAREGIDAVMDKHKLDALVAPTGGPAWPIDLVNGDHFGGRQLDAAGGRRLPEHHRAGGLRLRAAGGASRSSAAPGASRR